ncbi:MAG: DinB family protein [Saprospiraceae bacterium]
MKVKIANWITELEANTALFKQQFGGLSEEVLQWKPNPQSWSIAQNIDHLITVNGTYYPIVEQVRAGTYTLPWIARFSFLTRFFGNFIYNASGPDRSKKIKTFSVWEPSKSEIEGDILTRFEKHQADFAQFISACEDLLEKGLVISSPANKNIVYTLERAFDIIVVHEKRHFAQAKEVKDLMQG